MINWTSDHRPKVPVVRFEEFTLSLSQPNDDMTVIHCDIHVPWSRRVKTRLAYGWELLRFLHGGPIYALHTEDQGRKHEKFLKMYGFEPLERYVDAMSGLPTILYKTKKAPSA